MKKKNKVKKKPGSNKSKPTIQGPASTPTLSFNFNSGNSPSSGKEDAVYRKNMKVLEKTNPALAAKVRNTTIINYELINSAQGKAPSLRCKVNSLNYYSPEDPLGDAAEQVKALKLKNTRLAIFLGIGLGYELLYYFNHMANAQNTSFMLIIEKDLQVFKAALKTTDLSSILSNERVSLMVGLPESDLYVELRNYLARNSRFMFLKAMKPVYHSSSLILNRDYYMNALKVLRDSGAHQLLHFGNDPHDSIIGVENMMDNINEIIYNPGINLLYNKFKGKPGIVIATGPSLNKNKHLLKDLEEKALLIAVDASLKIMLEMGVKPHLVTSLERVPETVKLLEGFTAEQVQDVYFAGCPVVRNEAYEKYPGPRIIVYRNFDHFKWLNIDRGILDIQLSAGNMAFKVAEALGCDPIILIGQDLAYSRDGNTHAEGTFYGNKQSFMLKDEAIEVTGNDGKPISTTKTWYSFLKAYELDVKKYKGRCINSTEGGAYIHGTKVIPFQKAIEEYIFDSFCPLKRIEDNLKQFGFENAEQDYHNVLSLINKTTTDMQAIVEHCNTGLNIYNEHKINLIEYLAGGSEKSNFHHKVIKVHEAILKPKQKICSNYQNTYQLFFMHVLQSFNIKFEMEMIAVPEKHEVHEKTIAEITLRHSEWYSVVSNLSKIMLDLLLRTKEKLIQEQSDNKGTLRRASG